MGLWDSIKDKAVEAKDALEDRALANRLEIPDECREEWLAALRTLREFMPDGDIKSEKDL